MACDGEREEKERRESLKSHHKDYNYEEVQWTCDNETLENVEGIIGTP